MAEVIVDRRLIKTYFSKKPVGPAFAVSIGMLLLCGLVSRIYWMNIEASTYLNATKDLVFNKGEYWRLITTTFVHGDMGHLLSNSYMLGILGFFVYAYFGSFIYPFISVFLSGVVNAIAINTYPDHVSLVGASGMVYMLAGFWLTMFIFIERRRPISRRILIAMGAAILILFPESFEERVSYRTHAIGVAIGVAFAVLYFNLYKEKIRKAEVWEEIVEVHDEEGSQFFQ